MVSLELVVAAVSIMGVSWALWRLREIQHRLDTAPPGDERPSVRLEGCEEKIQGLEAGHDKLAEHMDRIVDRVNEHDEQIGKQTVAIAEGIERVDRAERRIRSTVRRAEERMVEAGYIDEAVEAEADGIRELDASERGVQGMQPVPEGMEERPQFDTSDLPGEWG